MNGRLSALRECLPNCTISMIVCVTSVLSFLHRMDVSLLALQECLYALYERLSACTKFVCLYYIDVRCYMDICLYWMKACL